MPEIWVFSLSGSGNLLTHSCHAGSERPQVFTTLGGQGYPVRILPPLERHLEGPHRKDDWETEKHYEDLGDLQSGGAKVL